MAEAQPRDDGLADRAQRAVRTGVSFVLTPPRTALVLALGSAVLITRAAQRALPRVTREGERQVGRINGALERVTSRLRSGTGARQDQQTGNSK